MKKVFLIILRIVFVFAFFALNLCLIYDWYSDYSEKQHELRELEIAQSKCTGDKPLFLNHKDEICVSCDYAKSVKIMVEGKNPCPNRKIVKDRCCGGEYSLLPTESKIWAKFAGNKGYCNPNVFCDPAPLRRIYFDRLGIVFNFVFYIFLLFGSLWSFKVLKAKWMALPAIIAGICMALISILI